MGGKSRKGGGVSRVLIDRLLKGSSPSSKKTCGGPSKKSIANKNKEVQKLFDM